MKYRISKSVPIPSTVRESSPFDLIPVDRLEIGDSIKLMNLPDRGYDKYQTTHRVGINMSAQRRKINARFHVGVYNSKSGKQLRVWRVE